MAAVGVLLGGGSAVAEDHEALNGFHIAPLAGVADGIIIDLGDGGGDVQGGQGGVQEGVAANFGDAVLDLHLGQAGAALKDGEAHVSDGGGDGHGLELGAVLEAGILHGPNAFGDDHGGHGVCDVGKGGAQTPAKGFDLVAVQGVGDHHIGCRAVVADDAQLTFGEVVGPVAGGIAFLGTDRCRQAQDHAQSQQQAYDSSFHFDFSFLILKRRGVFLRIS